MNEGVRAAVQRSARFSHTPRVLLGPVEIAGYYAGLARALREVGVHAVAVDLEGHPFRYETDPTYEAPFVRLARRAYRGRRSGESSRLVRWLWNVPLVVASLFALVWAILRFDAFIFSFGKTPLALWELPLLRRLGKRLIFVFNGSDARPPYIDGARMGPGRGLSITEGIALTRRMKRDISRIERYADVVVAQPAFSHFFERPVVNFFALGMPWRDQARITGGNREPGLTIKVVHAPSDPISKGSARIREVVEQLRAEGLPLQLIELQGVPNDVVLRELAGCDFAIDQVYSDAPMVGFATEAAVAGKPTIVGGYAWAENHRVFGAIPIPPVEECTPETLAEAILRLATDPERRASLGRAAQTYVRERWSPTEVGRRYLRLVEGPPPAEWMFDPRDLRYVEGYGLTRDQARELVAAVLREGGREALCVSDKPELLARFEQFAAES